MSPRTEATMAAAATAAVAIPTKPADISVGLPILETSTFEKKSSSSPIMLPSELPRSPLSALLCPIKLEEDTLKTPITPPTAYTDFLKALSPAVTTPMTASSLRSSFSFTDKSGHLTPITQPPSAGSNCSCQSPKPSAEETHKRKLPAVASAPLIPPSPFVKPAPARRQSARTPTTLGKLRIPESPTSSIISQSPRSATPRSADFRSATTPRSAAALRSPFSPSSWYIEGRTKMFGPPPLSAGGSSRHVSVKQVVTRTVTYTSKPLDPAPRGKRRKVE